MSRKSVRIIASLLAFILAFSISPFYEAQASVKEEMALDDKLSTAVVLLQDVMRIKYERMMDEVNSLVGVEGYDHAITFETFMDQGNPFRGMDYIEFIATFSAVNSELKKSGKRLDIFDLKYLEWSYEEDSFEEYKAFKVDEYTKTESGLYAKTGYHYSTQPEIVGIYEELDNPGLYRKIGEEEVNPEPKNTKYAVIDLKVITPTDIILQAGLDPAALAEDIERRKKILLNEGDNESLRSAVFINLPDRVLTQDEWNELFLQAIEYDPGHAVNVDGKTIVNIAATLTGQVPYEWGGKASHGGFDSTWWTYNDKSGLQKGLDCSGFVQWVYMTAGFSKEYTDQMLSTSHILSSNFKRVSEQELMPGDIGVVEHTRTNHCGIYAGAGEWYHSSSYSNTVVKNEYHFTKFYRPIPDGVSFTKKIRVYYPGEEPKELPVTEPEEITETPEETKEETVEEPVIEQPEEVPEEEREEKPEEITEETEEPQEVEDPDETDEATETEEAIQEQKEPEEIPVVESYGPVGHDEDDVMVLAKLISHEANNQGLNGWIAVGEVVRNRMNSTLFPNTVKEVIYQKGQFTNAASLASIKPRAEIINVARSVLSGGYGVINNGDVLYFRNAHGKTGNWGRHTFYTQVGAHSFYLQ